MLLVNSLIKHKIKVEAHLFPSGKHGLSVCNEECNMKNKSVSQWKDLSVNWLSNVFEYQIN